eukprot:665284-Karenia_brevis.AAC.1
MDAAICASMYLIKRSGTLLSRCDKATFYHEMAFKASVKALANDFSGAFALVRSLAGYTPKPLKAVKKLDG